MIDIGSGGDDYGSSNNGKPYVTTLLDTGTAEQPQWAYFDFDAGEKVDESTDWDIAVNRQKVKLNTNVKSVIVGDKDRFYEEGEPLKDAFINLDEKTGVDIYLAPSSISKEVLSLM